MAIYRLTTNIAGFFTLYTSICLPISYIPFWNGDGNTKLSHTPTPNTGHIRDKVYTTYCVTTIYYINSPRFHGENVEFSSMNRKYMCSVHKPVYFMDTRDVKPVYTYITNAWLFLCKSTSNFYTYTLLLKVLARMGKMLGQQMRVSM